MDMKRMHREKKRRLINSELDWVEANTHGKIGDNTQSESSQAAWEEKDEIQLWIFDSTSRIIANQFRSEEK